MNHDNLLLDKIADEFEVAWRSGQRPGIREFLKRVEKGLTLKLAELLIPLDLEYRVKAGEAVDADDYSEHGDEVVMIAARVLAESQFREPDLDATMDSDGMPRTQEPRTQELRTQDSKASKGLNSTRPLPAGEKSQQIGPYKLLQKLGEGGMGTVWMAEHSVPVKRRVALKVIKAGLDNKPVIARFEAERQALAMMNHENIARILDGGTTETGQPYFVMELVQGIPFTKYCDQHKLSIKDRLELFIPVCKAIQHAHQKGIIHRDLKPSNVLVSLYDGKPVPKVIDFGLAKALEHTTHLTDKTMFTEFGQVVGTLQYMSPEQAEMNQLDIDTRTDIYSLGVMLYELLTGSTPIETETLKKNAILQVLATIRDQEPPRPSARLSSSTNDAVSGISAQRQIDPARLKTILRGELDWIVMKSIEKDRTRRYETAIGLAADVKNYLFGEVVIARPPSKSYRIRKYVSRNKGLVASVTSISMLLFAGIVSTSWFAWETNKANKIANESKARTLDANEKTEATLSRSNFFLSLARWDQNRFHDANLFLDVIPERHRNIEWHLVKKMFEGNDLNCYGHIGAVSAGYSKDGNQIYSLGDDKELKVWDTANAACLATSDIGHNRSVRPVFAKAQKSVVSAERSFFDGQEPSVKLWSLESGNLLQTLPDIASNPECVAISQDENELAVGFDDSTILVWNIKTKSSTFLRGHNERILTMAFNPNGSELASLDADRSLNFWDLRTGKSRKVSRPIGDYSAIIAFARDGSQLVVCSRSKIEILDTKSGTNTGQFEIDLSPTCAAIRPDGLAVAIGTETGIINIYSLVTGQNICSLKGHSEQISSLEFSPDGARILSGCNDGLIKQWSSWNDTAYLDIRIPSMATCLAISNDSTRVASGCWDGFVRIWDARTWHLEREIQAGTAPTRAIAFSPTGDVIATGGDDGVVKIWEMDNSSPFFSFPKIESGIQSIEISPLGDTIAVGTKRGAITVFDLQSKKAIAEKEVSGNAILNLAFSKDGKTLAYCDNSQIAIWQIAKKDGISFLKPGSETINGLSIGGRNFFVSGIDWSHQQDLIAGPAEGSRIGIWKGQTGELVRILSGHMDQVAYVCFSPEGDRILSTDWSGVFKLWDCETGEELCSHKISDSFNVARISKDASQIIFGGNQTFRRFHPFAARSILVSNSGNVIVTSNLDSYRTSGEHKTYADVWKAGGKVPILRLSGSIDAFALSPDGLQLACLKKNMLEVWDLEHTKVLFALELPQPKGLHLSSLGVGAISYSTEGDRIVCGSVDGKITICDARNGKKLISVSLTGDMDDKGIQDVVFSLDGKTLYIRTYGKNFVLDSTSGVISQGDWKQIHSSRISRNYFGSIPSTAEMIGIADGNSTVCVDRTFYLEPMSVVNFEVSAKLDLAWHRLQADEAEKLDDWYAATFHRAWVMEADPDDPQLHDLLHQAYNRWEDQLLSAGYRDGSQNTKSDFEQTDASKRLDAQRHLVNGTKPINPRLLFPPNVSEMLKLPRGSKRPPLNETSADAINQAVWSIVKQPSNDASNALTAEQLTEMRRVVEQFPQGIYNNTLGTAEYRTGNYQAAIDACSKSLELTPKEQNLPGPHPGDLAILAMSHRQLGHTDKANQFREQLDEAMKHEKFKDDEECLIFAKEVAEMFDSKEAKPQAEKKPTEANSGGDQ